MISNFVINGVKNVAFKNILITANNRVIVNIILPTLSSGNSTAAFIDNAKAIAPLNPENQIKNL